MIKKCILSLKRIGIHDIRKENIAFYLNTLYISSQGKPLFTAILRGKIRKKSETQACVSLRYTYFKIGLVDIFR